LFPFLHLSEDNNMAIQQQFGQRAITPIKEEGATASSSTTTKPKAAAPAPAPAPTTGSDLIDNDLLARAKRLCAASQQLDTEMPTPTPVPTSPLRSDLTEAPQSQRGSGARQAKTKKKNGGGRDYSKGMVLEDLPDDDLLQRAKRLCAASSNLGGGGNDDGGHSPRSEPYWEELPGVVGLVNGSCIITTSVDLRPYLQTGREKLWLPAGVYECQRGDSQDDEWTSSTITVNKPYIGAEADSILMKVQRCPSIPAIPLPRAKTNKKSATPARDNAKPAIFRKPFEKGSNGAPNQQHRTLKSPRKQPPGGGTGTTTATATPERTPPKATSTTERNHPHSGGGGSGTKDAVRKHAARIGLPPRNAAELKELKQAKLEAQQQKAEADRLRSLREEKARAEAVVKARERLQRKQRDQADERRAAEQRQRADEEHKRGQATENERKLDEARMLARERASLSLFLSLSSSSSSPPPRILTLTHIDTHGCSCPYRHPTSTCPIAR
jgi:hypothetical protein